MGFKQEFHDTSVYLGNKLMAKIKELDPAMLATECLNCRPQFKLLLLYKVCHPIEILRNAFGLNQAEKLIGVQGSNKV